MLVHDPSHFAPAVYICAFHKILRVYAQRNGARGFSALKIIRLCNSKRTVFYDKNIFDAEFWLSIQPVSL